MPKYRVDGIATVPYALFIEANSPEEAATLAEEAHIGPGESEWGMSVDDYFIDVESVTEQKVHVIDIPKRDFDPAWDD